MKKIIRKFWGVGLVVVLLSTLFIGGTVPVANAGTLAWTAAGAPNPAGSNQVIATTNVDASIVEVASNGNIFVVDNSAATSIIWKSTNGGYSWTASTALTALTVVTDIVLSPAYATDGYVYLVANRANTAYCYQSSNGGVSFVQLGGAIGVAGTELATSIALQPTFAAGVGEIMVGTVDRGAGTSAGNIYIWAQLGTLNWTPQGFPSDITAVAYSPSYPIDQTIIIVSSNATGTNVNSKVFTNDWNGNFATSNISANNIIDFGSATGIVSTALAFPSDFNASNPLARTLYVGSNSGNLTADDVWRVGLAAAGVDMNYNALAETNVYSLSYSGTTASGTLYAGAVAGGYASTANPSPIPPAVPAWVPGGVASVGGGVTGATNFYVVASGGTIYVGTTGAESALNVSTNGGVSFIQTGLIDTGISVIQDFQPYSATEWYMVSENATNNVTSLWKTADGGVTYARINNLTSTTGVAAVRLSPNFGTDKTMYYFQVGAAPGVPILRISQDGGVIFGARFFPAAISGGGIGASDLLVVDATTLYAGSTGAAIVYKSTNNAFFWTPQAFALAGGNAITQFKRDAGTGHVLAGTNAGEIWRSTDGLTWAEVGVGIGAAAASVVAFDAAYGTNNVIYAGDSAAAVAGIQRFTIGTSLAWAAISATPGTGNTTGIAVAPDGVLYASDSSNATAVVGGVTRILNPTAIVPTVEAVATGDGFVAGNSLNSLAYLAGSNVLYSIQQSTQNVFSVMTYTDTMTTATPTVVSPADGAIVPALVVTITPIADIPVTIVAGYQVRFDTRADFLTGNAAVATAFLTNAAADNSGAAAGQTVYYQTRLFTPVIGPWSQTYTAVLQMAVPAAQPGPIIAGGGAGTTGPGGYDVALQPIFNWGVATGATGYEFQLATDADMTNLVVDLTGANALGNVNTYKSTKTLAYNTAYFWRVRGISATSNSLWTNVMSFMTMAAPVTTTPATVTAPAPTVTVNVPTPTVTVNVPAQPTPTTITEEVNPTYIWVIIIIGAVLVIAVIVLIVRTRRTV